MDSSKLKNIILVVLLAVNIVFAGLLLGFKRDAASSEKSMKKDLISVYAQHGIELSDSIDVSAAAPEEYILTRSEESELAAVKALLGHAAVYDQGGNVLYYSCEKGEACFRGTGEMEIIFSGSSWKFNGDAESAAKKAAKKLGIDPFVRAVDAGDLTVVELGWRFRGSEVFNSRIEMNFSQQALLMSVGQRAFDEVFGTTGAETKNCAAALVSFLALIAERGYDCDAVYSVEGGYIISVPVSGEATLTPVWEIETNNGNYYINAVSGREEQLW